MTASDSVAQPTRVLVLAKAPQPGRVKTRLIPVLGPAGAAMLARQMLAQTLQTALAAGLEAVELCMSPAPNDAAWQGVDIPVSVLCSAQGEGDLGQRMARAVTRVTLEHQQAVLLIGTDCPDLTAQHLKQAAQALRHHDAVLLGACDGGYVLLGLKAPCPSIFTDMPWSTPVVATQTLQRLAAQGLRVWQGPVLHDIDEPADLQQLPLFLQKNLHKNML